MPAEEENVLIEVEIGAWVVIPTKGQRIEFQSNFA